MTAARDTAAGTAKPVSIAVDDANSVSGLLQVPTKDVSGSTQCSPLPHCVAELQLAPSPRFWHLREPSVDTATQAPSTQSPSSRQLWPLRPEWQSPLAVLSGRTQRPPPQSPSLVQGA